MTFLSFVLVALVSTTIAFVCLELFVVWPAAKSYYQQATKTSLSRCLRFLNEKALKNGKIKDGEYLHDIFYKTVLRTLVADKSTIKVKGWSVKHTRKDELRFKKFQREINNLDEDTRKVVNRASCSIAKIVWLNNMVGLPLLIIKSEQKREEYLIRSGQYMAMSEKNELDKIPCNALS
ncbi:hypothetical protein JWG39_05350 [Desulforhopalus vacuolatus]|uniref:hypothetical protein n=1 Tax=Desulforhopalus vacuolatus TaxID=40414 RepID=UPI00196348E6|nr:hypothetical protein [Desulforhopalus vacuolatus]MBM9519246.1 hypothetical protein [Desulforhopalus vacuolatus]